MNIVLTGNPFVDTGLGVIAALAGLDDVTALTLAKIREVFGDGNQLAEWNCRLKTFTQVFGTNGPLFQTGYGYKKGDGPSSRNFEIYKNTLKAFLDSIREESRGAPCEACGNLTAFDFADACGTVIDSAGARVSGEKWIGRDWFPLSGSLGSDAQALPAASRPACLCPKCLFAVHYLPMALISIDGRLAVFQSTSIDFWYELVRDIVTGDGGSQVRIPAGQYETPGTKEGSRAATMRLLSWFGKLHSAAREEDVPRGTTLQVWRFANGKSMDCQVEEVPNSALRFLWTAVRDGLRKEVEELLRAEGKGPAGLLHCISVGRDYPLLFPHRARSGASPKLFVLYQTEVIGRPARVLSLAHMLARQVIAEVKATELLRLQRPEAFRAPGIRSRFRRLMWDLACQNDFTLEDYLFLFPPSEDERGVGVRSDGWDLIRYYLHHAEDQNGPTVTSDIRRPFGHRIEKVVYYAGQIFNKYVSERGLGRFKSDVVDRAAMGQIGTVWLQRQFTRLAEQSPGFTYAAWEVLCMNDAGISCMSELIFQMRLLWAEWLRSGTLPPGGIPVIHNESGLLKKVEAALAEAFVEYGQQRGVPRFRRDVLMRLQQRAIGLGWFRRKLVDRGGCTESARISESDWEQLLNDDTGRWGPSTRLFQMHLYLANIYRSVSRSNSIIESIEEDVQ